MQNSHTFSILIVQFGQIQYLCKLLKTDFKIQYFQCRVGTLGNSTDCFAFMKFLKSILTKHMTGRVLKHCVFTPL